MMSKHRLPLPHWPLLRQFGPRAVARGVFRLMRCGHWPSVGWSWRRPAKCRSLNSGFSRGFSLIEQIVAVGLVAVIVPSMAVLLSSLVRQASASGDAVAMLTLARSQLESIKEQPYRELPASYPAISPIPEEFAINVTAKAVKTYTYPQPRPNVKLPDEIQLVTVEVTCAECFPPVSALILQDYKVKR